MSKFFFAIAVGLCCVSLQAQAQDGPIRLVIPNGIGSTSVHPTGGFHPSSIALYDDGTRPVAGIINDKTGVDVSYILFPNDTPAPTAQSCGDAVVNTILNNERSTAKITGENRSMRTLPNAQSMYVVAFYEDTLGKAQVHQQELFGFYGNKSTCAEIHVSKALFKPADMPLLEAQLEQFDCDLNYKPSSVDYGALAGVYYNAAKDYKSAAYFYKAALDTYDDKPLAQYDAKTIRRMLTDQLSMSYGMSGDLKQSREVNETAIRTDPDYPLYYYTLACADAEAGDATSARNHLEQAFARKANVLPGETMPNPAEDDSFLKLKSNKQFWDFVQSLPTH